MAMHLKKGREGEQKALQYLQDKGYTLLERNYRYKKGEIDLILSSNGFIIFVEVKMRSSASFGFPEEFVDERKADLILATADQYVFEKEWNGPVRFDIVSVFRNEVMHYEDAFG